MRKLVTNRRGKVKSRKNDSAIDDLARLLLRFPQAELPTTHHFSGGVYRREMSIPKGCLLVGEIHRRAHFFEVRSGAIRVFDDEHGWRHLKPGFLGLCKPGVRRIGFADEATVCVTFERTEARTVKAAEKELFEPRKLSPMTDAELVKLSCSTNPKLKLLAA